MRPIRLALAVPFLTAIGLWAPGPSAPPLPGPGAVYQAVADLFAAVDAGDAARVGKAFLPMRHGDGWEWHLDAATGELKDRAPDREVEFLVFRDVGRDGSPCSAGSVQDASTALLGQVGGEGSELGTRILAVRADCQSEQCSWASVAFERTFRRPDGQRVAVPMHATALMRYQSEAPTMRIYLWHASPSGPAVLLKK